MTIKGAERIKKPLLIPLSVVLLLFIGVAILGTFRFQQKHLTGMLQADLQGVDQLFQNMLGEEAVVLNSLIDFYEHNESLQKAYLAENRDMLLQEATPIYKEIN